MNFIYVHLNRVIKEHDLNMIYITGPGHGGPGLVANTYLEGTYSEVYPNISQDEAGDEAAVQTVFVSPAAFPAMSRRKRPARFMKAANWAIRSSHAFGAAFDNPDLLVACVVGDGEAETGPLATSWHSNKFLNPVHDGAVLPDPAFERIQDRRIRPCWPASRATNSKQLFRGYGYTPYFVEGR